MLKKYYRLTKPGIIYGNLLSTVGAFFFASNGQNNLTILVSLIIGTSLIIGSACVFNNYIDRDIDSKMKRTKDRALVNGDIPDINALIFGGILAILGFLTLFILINPTTLLVGFTGFVWYVFIYTYSKRSTSLSTLIGTVSGATPPVAGYVAVTNRLDLASFILFMSLVFWQMPHFYAISIYRLKEYMQADIPLLSITKGVTRTKIEIIVYAGLFLITAPLLSVFGFASASYGIIIALISLIWIRTMIENFYIDQDKWARKVFGQSLIVLLVFSLSLGLNSYLL